MTLDSLEDGDRPKPDGWTETNLGEVCRHKSGNSHLIKGKLHDRPGEGLFQAFSASGPDVWHTDWEHEGPAIVVSAVGARCGKAFRADGRWSAVANTHVVRTDPQRLDRDYAFLMLNDESFWVKSGSAQPFVKVRETLARPILLPPLPEQRRIVGKIEELLASANAAYQRLARVPAILKRFRQSVLAAACCGRLTEDWRLSNSSRPTDGQDPLPTGWHDATVAELGRVTTGNTPSKSNPSFYGGTVRFFKPGDLDVGYKVERSVDSLTAKGAGAARVLPPMSVMVTCIGATIGKTGLSRVAGATNQQINSVVVDQGLARAEYLFFFFSSLQGQGEIRGRASVTTLPILNKGRFSEIPVPLPPLVEQLEIVRSVEALFAFADTIEQRVAAATARADRLTQAILAKAFRGELVPTNVELARRAARQLTSVPTSDTSK